MANCNAHDALPLVHEDAVVVVAFANPTDYEAIDGLTPAAGRPLRFAVATPSAIRNGMSTTLP